MADFSKEFLEKTRRFWESRYGSPLTPEDAREIAESMTGLFQLLDKLDGKYANKTAKTDV